MSLNITRPRAEHLLRAWGEMIAQEAEGDGFSFLSHRQQRFENRLNTFLDRPTEHTLEVVWSKDSFVAADNPHITVFLAPYDDIDEVAMFLDELCHESEYNPDWEDTLIWKHALWELYTRTTPSTPGILSTEAIKGLRWFGIDIGGGFDGHLSSLAGFREYYTDVVAHPTGGTPHEVPIRIELEQLFHAIKELDQDAIATNLKTEYGDFYRLLYGGSDITEGRTDPVQLVDIGPLVSAYAYGKMNGAYDAEGIGKYYGGENFWETWKETYCTYVDETIREEFTLTELEPEDVQPLFSKLTDTDATDLSSSVVKYLMGGRWGQYVWNDIEDYFVENPDEGSAVLSEFFDISKHEVPRLQAFREHTIHITDTEGRSPGSIERMATSLLMVAEPDKNIGLPPSKTATFVEAKTTLEDYKSGFRPIQYGVIIPALRTLRDEIQLALDTLKADQSASMLDVHNLIWMYEESGEPSESEIPNELRR